MIKSRVAKGALAGAIGGLVGTWAMNRFARSALGRPAHRGEQKTGATAAQFAFGAAMGAAYGAFWEISPATRKMGGAAFGTAAWATADEVALAAAGQAGSTPGHRPERGVPAFASHVVYGVTTEIVRRGVRALLNGGRQVAPGLKAGPTPFDPESPPSRSRSARGSSDLRAPRGRRDT